MAFHTDGHILAAGSFEKSLWLYDIRAAEPIGAMSLPQVTLSFTPCTTAVVRRLNCIRQAHTLILLYVCHRVQGPQ